MSAMPLSAPPILPPQHCVTATQPTRFQLPNGLTVVHQWIPQSAVAVADVWVRAGSQTEPISGMAHFLEHLIFKGSDRLAPGQFDAAIEGCGGYTNAATSYDYAHYYITVAADQMGEMLPYLSDLVLNAAIPEVEFDRERQVVLEEILQANDEPDGVALEALLALLYPEHPYGRPILGTEESLMQQTADSVRRFHRSRYQPENMTLIMVGGISEPDCRTWAETCFSQFPDRAAAITPAPQPAPSPPQSNPKRRELSLPQVEQTRLSLAWVAPGIEDLPTTVSLELAALILADGRTSRLVKDLREEQQIVQDIQANYTAQADSGIFMVTAWLEDEADLAAVEQAIVSHLTQFQQTGPTPEELNRAQQVLAKDFIFACESPGQLTGLYGYYNTIGQLTGAQQYPELIPQITANQIQDLAVKWMPIGEYAATVLRPEEEGE